MLKQTQRVTHATPSGLTLVELLIALALFSALTILGAQGMVSMLGQGEVLGRYQTKQRETLAILRLLERDIRAIQQPPVFVQLPGGAASWEWQFGQVSWRSEQGGAITRVEKLSARSSEFQLAAEKIEILFFQQDAFRDADRFDQRLALDAAEIRIFYREFPQPVKHVFLISGVGL